MLPQKVPLSLLAFCEKNAEELKHASMVDGQIYHPNFIDFAGLIFVIIKEGINSIIKHNTNVPTFRSRIVSKLM